MDEKTTEARDILDYMLFHNVYNMPERDPWEVTFEGDNYVMWNMDTDELFHFRVTIEEHEWDSTEARESQEWDV
jgi:hypothetical protein